MATFIAVVALALAVAAVAAAIRYNSRLTRAAVALDEARAREASALRESAAARRASTAAAVEQQALSRLVRELPFVIHELHGGVGRRDVPQLLLNIVVRLLEPARAFVSVVRQPAAGQPCHLAIAAVWPPHEQQTLGTAITPGEGEFGYALELRRVLDRHDFDMLPASVRNRLAAETPPDWKPDLVAPLVFKEDLAGGIAVQGPGRNPAEVKDVLRLVAHLGAVALYTNARYDQMKANADTDGLTGLLNKRSVSMRLADEVRVALTQGQTASAFMFDIDHFKHYNDRNGHLAGDHLLQALTRLARQHTRPDTVFGRFGGEEFLMVFPNATQSQAFAAAENVRLAIAKHEFEHGLAQPLGRVSISGGVAECPRDAMDATQLIRVADEALYGAKRAGRNRVFTYRPQYVGEEKPLEPAGETPDSADVPPWYVSWEDEAPTGTPSGPTAVPPAGPATPAPAAAPTPPQEGDAPDADDAAPARPAPRGKPHAQAN